MSSKIVEADAGVHSLAMAVAVSHAKPLRPLAHSHTIPSP